MRDGLVKEGKEEGTGGKWHFEEDSEGEKNVLVVAPDSKKDYWSRTYYKPKLIKHDGPAFLRTFDATQPLTVRLFIFL